MTSEQQDILQGGSGLLLGKYLRWLIEWGEAMGARRLVPVTSVHAILRTPSNLACSQRTVEKYIAELRQACSHRVKYLTTTQVASASSNSWRESGASEDEAAARASRARGSRSLPTSRHPRRA